MKKKVYIAGKVTGEPKHACALKFAMAEKALVKKGFEVVNPLNVVGDPSTPWHLAMRKCIAALMTCDAIHLLPDWQESNGASIEKDLAVMVKLQFIEL